MMHGIVHFRSAVIILALLCASIVTARAVAEATSKTPSATHVYRLEVATVATQALAPAFPPQLASIRGSLSMKFQLDRRGQIHNLRITSNVSDRWVEDTAKRILQNTKFPPIPADVIKEIGRDTIDIDTLWSLRDVVSSQFFPSVTGAELFDYGIYDIIDTGKSQRARNTASGTWDITPFASLVKKTDVIHVRDQTDFGIRYRLTGKSGAQPAEIRVQLVHPPITNPKTGKSISVESFRVYVGMRQLDYRGYLFAEPWQKVPGTWTFQLYAGSKLILEKPFQIIIDK